ncbi:UDP-2,3-diacylglucosamine diphosphatase LpxI [Starkeya koreensis]|uniref:UDP-2,3-diacylglucosamine diphosphatase LpxI n=1 Tax=Ancylobacter koreensis TaxID=266121 RepID=A0ABT0DMF3_9HYPH|nr:UDP-2,3-diacylglucosamine diphosphatase LpxI [Ancylobacter koreensis]MCK0208435.1 UDP-2,3-diacylglucosamine diphosphatase LpxI [Ancylobacter koreensis]
MSASPKPPEGGPAGPEAPAPGAPLAIICGGGAFPLAVAQAARQAGRRVVLFPIRGFADPWVEAWPHAWIHIGRFGLLTRELRRRGCRDVVFIGNVLRPRVRDIRLDWTTLTLLPRVFRMLRGGDDHLLTSVGRLFEEAGFRLVGAHEIAPEILIPAGRLGAVAPDAGQMEDIELGRRVLAITGPLDIGQGLVVMNRHIVAMEAAEGTDLMLARVAELRAIGRIKMPTRCGVLVKRPKEGQDRRLDLPSLGVRTVEGAARAGLAGIAVEAGGVIVSDVEALLRAADAAGVFIHAFARDEAGDA